MLIARLLVAMVISLVLTIAVLLTVRDPVIALVTYMFTGIVVTLVLSLANPVVRNRRQPKVRAEFRHSGLYF